jgi:hypothetical protein
VNSGDFSRNHLTRAWSFLFYEANSFVTFSPPARFYVKEFRYSGPGGSVFGITSKSIACGLQKVGFFT